MIKRTLTILLLASAFGMDAAAQPAKRFTKYVPTFTVALPVTEGSFKIMRGDKEAFLKPGFTLAAGDVVMNSSATPLRINIMAAGGHLAGALFLADTTKITITGAGISDGMWRLGVTLDYGFLDSQVDTARYGYTVQSAGCTVVPNATHFLMERSSAKPNATTITTVFRGEATITRPGFYKRYYPVEYLVNAGQQLRFFNTDFKTPRGFYEHVAPGTKMVHRQADIMSDQGN